MEMLSGAMWNTQQVLHKNPQLVPGTLMSVAVLFVVHLHLTEQEVGAHDDLKTFVSLIIVQMLPLVALELKIMSCADPVGLFCKFASPVTLVHIIFLGFRFMLSPYFETSYLICSGFGLTMAVITLFAGLREPILNLILNPVWLLAGFCIIAAPVTTIIVVVFGLKTGPATDILGDVVSNMNNYLELMAFVPAVWTVYMNGQSGVGDVESGVVKRKATAFFTFLVTFYLTEDVLQAWGALSVAPIAAAAHMLHFILLCDFACYVLAHIYNVDQLVGELRKWLPVDKQYNV